MKIPFFCRYILILKCCRFHCSCYLFADNHINETNFLRDQNDDSSFVIHRKLLRRRHVRKLQKRSQQEHEEQQLMVLSGVSAITAQKRHGKNYTCLYSLHRQQEQKERMSSLDCLCAPPLSFPILKTARSTHRQQQHDYNHHLFYPLDTIRSNSDHCHNRDMSAKEARMKTVGTINWPTETIVSPICLRSSYPRKRRKLVEWVYKKRTRFSEYITNTPPPFTRIFINLTPRLSVSYPNLSRR